MRFLGIWYYKNETDKSLIFLIFVNPGNLKVKIDKILILYQSNIKDKSSWNIKQKEF